jgi:pyridoxine 4-dehydrogenase
LSQEIPLTIRLFYLGCFTVFSLENDELEDVVATAYLSNAAFFDTAERYGSHIKTAMGLGYGETELLTNKLLKKALLTEGPARVKPVVATKFTPLPFRTTVESVVEACEQSKQRLGVDQIDLYQIHMPDSKFSFPTVSPPPPMEYPEQSPILSLL